MDIIMQRRAKIALRSLEQNEQKQILKALEQIELTQSKDLFQIPQLKKLRNLDENLYMYRGSHRLRLVLSIQGDVCIVEDILAHDKLDRLIANLKQQ